jgi:hypothetical protein
VTPGLLDLSLSFAHHQKISHLAKMMDSDDDDIYPQHNESNGYQAQTEDRMEDVEDGEEEGEEVEDSDVWHIL